MRLNYCDEENKQFQLEVSVREITENRIYLREHVWIDRETWKLTNGDDEYTLVVVLQPRTSFLWMLSR